MIRLFFGLAVSATAAMDITTWRDRVFPAVGRPVPAANLHITLAFLGDLSEHRLEALCEAVDAAATPGPLDLTLDQVGYWPKTGICWLGPANWPEALGGLAARLDRIGNAHGGKRSRRRYRPHVTLFRGCDTPPPAPIEPARFTLSCDHFCLYQSHRGPRGVAYSVVESWSL